MKEAITKFDLEAAFKALDEIDTPVASRGLKANKAPLTEIFSRKSKFEALFEEYYDVGSSEELNDAKAAREAEIAKAKLARIEKIVDLDADSPEDLLTSYVGKYIMQCPQCMTLFYKNPEDIEESEEDPATVNVNEVCQHCGNEAGYMLIGKVGAAAPEEDIAAEEPTEEENLDLEATDDSEENAEEAVEEPTEEDTEEDTEDFDLDSELAALDLSEPEEDEKKEESFIPNEGTETLIEQLTENAENTDMEVSAEEFEKLISTSEFTKPISDNEVRSMMQEINEQEEEKAQESLEVKDRSLEESVFDKLKDKVADTFDAITSKLKTRESKINWILEKAMKDYNNFKTADDGEISVTDSNQRFKTFLVIGYKDTFSNGKAIVEAPKPDVKDLVLEMGPKANSKYQAIDDIAKGWSLSNDGPAFIYLAANEQGDDAIFLCEYFKGKLYFDQTENYFERIKNKIKGTKLVNRGEEQVEQLSTNEALENKLSAIMESVEELQETTLESLISDSLIKAYGNVAGFRLGECSYLNEQFAVNGTIYFTSGNTRKTSYVFTEAQTADEKIVLQGLNEKLGLDKKFNLTGSIDSQSKTFITESFTCIKK